MDKKQKKAKKPANIHDRIPKSGKKVRGLQTYASYTEGYKVGGGFTLCDPLTQIARRIQGFFEKDPEVITAFNVNNQFVPGEGQDHQAELCVYVQCGKDVTDTQKADSISAFIRHRHVYPEYGFDGSVIRNHVLNVRVFAVGAVDPNDPSQTERISECTFITDEAEQCNPRKIAQKWEMLKIAFRNNPNVADMDSFTSITGAIWRFIECARDPITFQEDNLTNLTGYNSVLAADILPLVFVFNGDFQISTATAEKTAKLGYAFNW